MDGPTVKLGEHGGEDEGLDEPQGGHSPSVSDDVWGLQEGSTERDGARLEGKVGGLGYGVTRD